MEELKFPPYPMYPTKDAYFDDDYDLDENPAFSLLAYALVAMSGFIAGLITTWIF